MQVKDVTEDGRVDLNKDERLRAKAEAFKLFSFSFIGFISNSNSCTANDKNRKIGELGLGIWTTT